MSRLYLKTSSEECVANSVIHYTSYAAEKNERLVNILQGVYTLPEVMYNTLTAGAAYIRVFIFLAH